MKKNFLIIVILIASGCASTQRNQALTEGCGGGVVAGALLGAALGAAIDGGRGAAIGAGAGALLGGVGGCVYADYVSKRHEQLSGRESDLNAQIQFAKNVADDTLTYNNQLKQDIASFEKEIEKLNAEIDTSQLAQQRLKHQDATLRKKVATAHQIENQLASSLNDLKHFREQQSSRDEELDREISRLEQQLSLLRSNTQSLASLSNRI